MVLTARCFTLASALFGHNEILVNRHILHEALHAVHHMVSIDFVDICYTREVRFVKVQLLVMNFHIFQRHGLSMKRSSSVFPWIFDII